MSSTSSRLGRPRSSRSLAAIRMPGVQKPHWSAWCSRKAACSGVNSPSPASALDRLDARAVHLRREHEARANGGAVDPDRAGAADAVLAADMRAPQSQLMAQEVRQQQPRLHQLAAEPAVDLDRDRDHGASNAFRQARPTARSTRTRVSCFRYAGEAWRFPGGSTAAAASSPASRAVSASTARPASPTSTTSGRSATEPSATRPCSTRSVPNGERTGRETEAVVAAPLRQLLERVARPGWRGRPDRVDDELVRLERRQEVRDEEAPPPRSFAAPLVEAATTDPPRTVSASGSSAAGSAWAIEPPTVPRLRVAKWPT